MRGGEAAALAICLVLLAPGARADVLQRAYDAGHSGDAKQPGPEWDDIAYIRAATYFRSAIAIVDGIFYFQAGAADGQPAPRTIWTLDLDSGVLAPFAVGPEHTVWGASDGERLILVGDLAGAAFAYAYDRATGARVWRTALGPAADLDPTGSGGASATTCGIPALAEGSLYVVCASQPSGAAIVTVHAIDSASGRTRWSWTAQTDASSLEGLPAGGASLPASGDPVRPLGVTLAAGWVIAVTATKVEASQAAPVSGVYWDAWVLSPTDGKPPPPHEPGALGLPGGTEPRFGHHPNRGLSQSFPSPNAPALFAGNDHMFAYKDDARSEDVGPSAPSERVVTLIASDLGHTGDLRLANATDVADRGTALVVGNGSVFAASGRHLWRLDERLNIAWHRETEPEHRYVDLDPILAGDRLYVATHDAADHATLEARDARDGSLVWSELFASCCPVILIDGELLVTVDYDRIVVHGRTSGSLHPVARMTREGAGVGEAIGVDLGGTTAGEAGNASAFRVDWGDGSATEWTGVPTFEHAYASPGDVTARFFARNDGGQSASVARVFHIGNAAAPPAPSWRAAPFSREHLPLTLLLAALVAIGGAGGTGLLLAHRRSLAVAAGRAHAVVPGALVLGRYRVVRELGAGASGRAFLAVDTRMKRDAVLKTVHSRDEGAAVREARAAAAIDHPNVVRVYDVEDLASGALIVMEHVDGGSLRDRLTAGGALSEAAFARVADELLLAIAAVHATGAIHRDIKPGNVLLTRDGHAKLADFGIARLPGFEATVGGAAVGSVQYMAPEQARGRRVTPASDLYSAAATLFEARTGRPLVAPLPDESATEMQMRVGAGRVFDEPVAPAALAAWFAKGLAIAPGDRFASATQMRAALGEALRGVEPSE